MISTTPQIGHSPFLSPQAAASTLTQPLKPLNISLVRSSLEKVIQGVHELDALEENTKTMMPEIKKRINFMGKEINNLLLKEKGIGLSLNELNNKVEALIRSSKNGIDGDYLRGINKMEGKIHQCNDSISILKLKKIMAEKELGELGGVSKDLKNKSTLFSSEIEALVSKKKSIDIEKSKNKDLGESLKFLNVLRQRFVWKLKTLLKDVSESVQSIPSVEDKARINALIDDFVVKSFDCFLEEFFIKKQKNNKISLQDCVKEKIQSHYNELVSKIRPDDVDMGYNQKYRDILFGVDVVFVTIGFMFLVSAAVGKNPLFSDEDLSSNAFHKKLENVAVSLLVVFVAIQACFYSLIKKGQNMKRFSSSGLISFGENNINEVIAACLAETDALRNSFYSDSKSHKKTKEAIGLVKNKQGDWFTKKLNDFLGVNSDLEIEEIDLDKCIDNINGEKNDIGNRLMMVLSEESRLKRSINEASEKIFSLSGEVESCEKILLSIREKGKKTQSQKSNELDRLWKDIKNLKNQLDDCNMQKEIRQAELRSLELNLQKNNSELQLKKSEILKLKTELNVENIAKNLLMPNMTEQAFERLIERHMAIESNQLRQRIEKGEFKNSESITIQAPANKASTYKTFYHLLYATIDAIEFIQNNQSFAANNDACIKHKIEVGADYSEQSGLLPKSQSVVSYKSRINPSTGRQNMVIDHMY